MRLAKPLKPPSDYSALSNADRSAFLNRIADEIEARGAEITEIGTQETGLRRAPAALRAKVAGPLARVAPVRHAYSVERLADRRYDLALPDRQPAPRPDIKLIQRPVGPVAVFGASNFPLAFSVAGGDAGLGPRRGRIVRSSSRATLPILTGEIVAQAIDAAIKASGVLQDVQLAGVASARSARRWCRNSFIKAVGFTGLLAGGRALFHLCAARPEPIPFFGELGSVNPMFLLCAALAARGEAIAKGWAGSLTLGAGQFCTNPGIAVVGSTAPRYFCRSSEAAGAVGFRTMLTDGIAEAFRAGRDREWRKGLGSGLFWTSTCDMRNATPYLFEVSGADFAGSTYRLQKRPSGLRADRPVRRW